MATMHRQPLPLRDETGRYSLTVVCRFQSDRLAFRSARPEPCRIGSVVTRRLCPFQVFSCGLCEETGLKRVLTRKCERGQNSRLLAVIVRTEHPEAPRFTPNLGIRRQLSLFSGINPNFCVEVKLGCILAGRTNLTCLSAPGHPPRPNRARPHHRP